MKRDEFVERAELLAWVDEAFGDFTAGKPHQVVEQIKEIIWQAAQRETEAKTARIAELERQLAEARKDYNDAVVALMEQDDVRRAELKVLYPDIAGDHKVFKIFINTESGCAVERDEYSVAVSHIVNGWIEKDDMDLVLECVAEDVTELGLPEEGSTAFIAYESGEREGFAWNRFYRLVAAPIAAVAEQTKQQEPK
jgi:hypothetical protein